MGITVMKAKTQQQPPAGAGSKRRGGERSEPERSGEPAPACPLAPQPSDPEVLERPVRRSFTADYKARIVREAAACTEPGQIGALLRREGLYSSHLEKWRRKFDAGGVAALSERKRGRKPTRSPQDIENESLRKQNARLARRLKQAEAIIDFQKKISETLAEMDENDGNG